MSLDGFMVLQLVYFEAIVCAVNWLQNCIFTTVDTQNQAKKGNHLNK